MLQLSVRRTCAGDEVIPTLESQLNLNICFFGLLNTSEFTVSGLNPDINYFILKDEYDNNSSWYFRNGNRFCSLEIGNRIVLKQILAEGNVFYHIQNFKPSKMCFLPGKMY